MKACFADTFFFLALISSRDRSHAQAVRFSQSLTRHIVTTTWVLTELADAMCRPPWRERFTIFLDRLRHEPRTIIVPTTDDLFETGMDLYLNRPDKEWSLTDCISFVVMEREGLTDALTGDNHYEQAGFVALLK
jgi:predicted nucleic acid-binding protein